MRHTRHFYNILGEGVTPDGFGHQGQNHRFDDKDARPFILFKDGSVMWGSNGDWHGSMMSDAAEYELIEQGVLQSLGSREMNRAIWRRVKELQENIYLEGRWFGSVTAITYWPYDRNDIGWDEGEHVVEINLTPRQLNYIVGRLKATDNEVRTASDEDLLIQWNDKLIPYTELLNLDQDQESESDEDTKDLMIIHLANQDDKRKAMGQFLSDRGKHQSDRLTNPDTGDEMTRAEYNNLKVVGDSKIYTKRQIEERIDSITSLEGRKRVTESAERPSKSRRIVRLTKEGLDLLARVIIEEKLKPKHN